MKRQESSFPAVNQGEAREEAEHLETEEDAETFSTASATPGRNAALSAAILRVLEVANAKPTPVDPTGSYSGRRRRSAQLEPVHSNAHQYGLLEPKVELVKVSSRWLYNLFKS